MMLIESSERCLTDLFKFTIAAWVINTFRWPSTFSMFSICNESGMAIHPAMSTGFRSVAPEGTACKDKRLRATSDMYVLSLRNIEAPDETDMADSRVDSTCGGHYVELGVEMRRIRISYSTWLQNSLNRAVFKYWTPIWIGEWQWANDSIGQVCN